MNFVEIEKPFNLICERNKENNRISEFTILIKEDNIGK